ncbi:MAG: class I SAM-dependent methyltransferase [Elusimicrobia bacterium]|nr:class I SAM-dependent methyltransferase [Elusimicrobiota bacterium]
MAKKAETREPQYQRCLDLKRRKGLASLGLGTSQLWSDDPRHLLFLLSRYKFAAKMLAGRRRVLEAGCGDAFATRLVQQTVGRVTAVDFDPVFIADARARQDPDWPLDLRVHDLLRGPVPGRFDAAYALDVLEHVPARDEDRFLRHVARSLTPDGILLVGMPSIQSQAHASPPSKAGHVNCKDQPALQALLERHFRGVFVFSMNDEVVHTGFSPMAHYLLALGCRPRRR